MKKLLMGIALLGAFSFSQAQTTAAGNAFANWLGQRDDNLMVQILGQAYGASSSVVTPALTFASGTYVGTIVMNVAQFDTSFVFHYAANATGPAIDEYREYQQDTNSLLTSIPFGTGAYDYVPISGSCIARGGDASNEGGTNRTTVAGETLRFYHARIGTGGNTYAYRWRAETSLTQKTQTSTSAGSLQTFYSNVAIIDNSAKVCAPTANLYNWTLGAFANGTPTPEIYSEMRGWARPWVRSWDVSGTYVPRAGISHEPTLTLVQAQEPCPGTECVYTPPDGGTGGTGDTTIDTDSEAGACNQISGNWFTKFWQNIESTFQCVFIPTISPVAEWQSVVNEANERIPFSYVSSIVYEGGNLCNMRDFSQLPESGDMENLQFESFACSGGVIEVQLPFSGIPYLEARDTRLRIDLLNNPVGLWMQNIGKHILWALLLLGFYYKLVIYAFSNQWVVSNDN